LDVIERKYKVDIRPGIVPMRRWQEWDRLRREPSRLQIAAWTPGESSTSKTRLHAHKRCI